MKTQTVTKKYSMLLFSALASLMLMTAACQKNNGGNNNPAPVGPIYPGCTVQPCAGGPGQVPLYGGMAYAQFFPQIPQAQFQVTGDQSGNGMGFLTATVNFNNYLCQTQMGAMPLNGQYSVQMTGNLISDVFYGTGSLMVAGPMGGGIPVEIRAVPVRTAGTGEFAIGICGSVTLMNF